MKIKCEKCGTEFLIPGDPKSSVYLCPGCREMVSVEITTKETIMDILAGG